MRRIRLVVVLVLLAVVAIIVGRRLTRSAAPLVSGSDASASGSAAPPVPARGDCYEWFDAWEQSRKDKGLTSVRDNRGHYEHHIRCVFGSKHVADWVEEDGRRLVQVLDEKVQNEEMHWKTAVNVWGTASKMASDAATSKIERLRVRKDDPFRDVKGPDRGAERAKQFLFPSEFLRFVSCEDVPLAWRRSVAIAVYTYVRDGEHRELRNKDVDLPHTSLNITRAWDRREEKVKPTKTKRTRRFSIEPELIPLLKAMRAERGDAPDGFVDDPSSERDMARGLRRWLQRSGIDRGELYETT